MPTGTASAEDQAFLKRVAGLSSFARGVSYRHRVMSWHWQGPELLTGRVRGSAAQPYTVSISLRRGSNGHLRALEGTCSCPMAVDCKHVVALFLTASEGSEAPEASRAPVAGRSPGPGPARPAAGWERRLAPLLEPPLAEGGPRVGLQLEPDPGQGPASGGRRRPSVGLRPIALSPAGNWVRTGISWWNLPYYRSGGHRPTEAALRLLAELAAMGDPAAGRYYPSREGSIPLEKIASRRLWDLLAELGELGAPLGAVGRASRSGAGAPVRLEAPVEVVIDVTGTGSGLVMAARYESDGNAIPAGSTNLLVGAVPHGMAWWDEADPAAKAPAVLHLAPLARSPGPAELALVEGDGVAVPRREVPRFLGALPRLRRRVSLASSDGAVDLAHLPEVSLVLSVRHRPDHVVELSWWRGLPDGWRGELWPAEAASDPAVEDAARAALSIVGKLAVLSQADPSGSGPRLAPDGWLAGMDAVVFVSDLLPRLRELEGLEIEEEGSPLDYRAATEAPVVRLGGRAGSQGDWFDLAVEITVAGEEVAFGDLFVALAGGQSHLILPSGTYFPLDRPELAELARLIAEARELAEPGAAPETIRLSRFDANLFEELAALGVLDAQAGAWQQSVKALLEAGRSAAVAVPESLAATLRPYQAEGFSWLSYLYDHGLGGILADDMGLGKTLQALALVCRAVEEGVEHPFLVVAPTSVVGNWCSEAARFAPHLSVIPLAETAARRGTGVAEEAHWADIVVTSYALLRLDHEEYEAVEWAGVFLDEAQFVKNSASHGYARARSLSAPFKVALTGTPMENNLMELWSLLSITAPGLFPRKDRFAEHYRLPIERQDDRQRLDQLRRRIRPLMLRRTKEAVAGDLPDKQEQVLELELEPRHRRVYQTYLQRERQKVLGLLGDMEKNRFAIFRSLTLLRQACLDLSLVDDKHARMPSTKLDALMPMLTDIVADGHRVLVFSQFTRYLALARRRLDEAGIDFAYLDGRTRRRAEVIDSFRSGEVPVFLISLKAGGFGLNLTEADYCILLDPWWNPATEAQAVDRAHRIGQTRKVMVYRLVAKDTIEEKVMALKAKKAALFSSVVDDGGFESAALSAEDIRELLG